MSKIIIDNTHCLNCSTLIGRKNKRTLEYQNVAKIFFFNKLYVNKDSKVCWKCYSKVLYELKQNQCIGICNNETNNDVKQDNEVNIDDYLDITNDNDDVCINDIDNQSSNMDLCDGSCNVMYSQFEKIAKKTCTVKDIMNPCLNCIKCIWFNIPIHKKYIVPFEDNNQIFINKKKELNEIIVRWIKKPLKVSHSIISRIKKKDFHRMIGYTFEQFDVIVKDVCKAILNSGVSHGEAIVNDDVYLKNGNGIFEFKESTVVLYLFHMMLFLNCCDSIRKKEIMFGINRVYVMNYWKNGIFLMKKYFNSHVLNTMDLNVLKKDDEVMMNIIKEYVNIKHPRQGLGNNLNVKYICIVDGWTIPTESISNFKYSYKLFSRKDHYHGVRFLVICDLNGVLVNIYGPFFCDGHNSGIF